MSFSASYFILRMQLVVLLVIISTSIVDAFKTGRSAFGSSPRGCTNSRSFCSTHRRGSGVSLAAATATAAFNPFLSRNKNSGVKWFDSDLDMFYRFVEDQPMLTAEQELQFGRAVAMWNQVEALRIKKQSELGNGEWLSDAELAEAVGCSKETLYKMSKYAGIAKNRLVNSNLKLVLAVVSRYRTSNVPNSELIAEGTRGLARAVLRYDFTKGYRFATYATWYVHQAVSEYSRWRKNPTKMPSRYTLLLRKLRQFTTDHRAKTGSSPSITQIAEGLGETHFDVIKVLNMQTYPTLLAAPIKLNEDSKGIDHDKMRSVGEVLPSAFLAPADVTNSKIMRRGMEQMMQANLNDVERDVLRLRLGLDGGRIKPVKEVGRQFQISWKQVRTVERTALSKLHNSEQISEFASSYNMV